LHALHLSDNLLASCRFVLLVGVSQVSAVDERTRVGSSTGIPVITRFAIRLYWGRHNYHIAEKVLRQSRFCRKLTP